MDNEKTHLTSAAAFVEGGIQEACEDACSICLEPFCETDPSTVTSCKHEYHLQCILEWAQRSKQCPMCWQFLSLKDPASQELLEAVEQERTLRMNRPQNAPIFPHISFEDLDLHNVRINSDDPELEERIMQHLAAAAAMGRARRFTRRETSHDRASAQGHSQILLFSSHPNVPPLPDHTSAEGGHSPTSTVASPITPLAAVEEEQLQRPSPPMQVDSDSQSIGSASMTSQDVDGRSSSFPHRNIAGQPSMEYHERSRLSEMQSFSESLKSRFTSMSSRCKESFAKATRGFRERLSARNSAVTDHAQEAQQEVSDGIAGVTRMMEFLDTNGRNRGGIISISDDMEGHSVLAPARQQIDDDHPNMCSGNNSGVNLCTASPGSSEVAPQLLNDESSSGYDLFSQKVVEDDSGAGTGLQGTYAVLSP
uniref:RING-type E3 ubiquitin transferase n=1 Tax=Picea sitchensis TaxID=3332 RepID=A9NWL0_PICSI|nr:unknown [Picea sitchensis]